MLRSLLEKILLNKKKYKYERLNQTLNLNQSKHRRFNTFYERISKRNYETNKRTKPTPTNEDLKKTYTK